MSQLGYAQATLLGRLTRDPGHRREGQDPVNCAIAVNHTKDKVSFFEVEVWADAGKSFREHAKKGDQVLFITEPYVSTWTGKEGERKEVRFKVLRWQFTGGGAQKTEHHAATLQEAREKSAAAEDARVAQVDRPEPADSGLSADELLRRMT